MTQQVQPDDQLLLQLLVGCGLVTREELDDFKSIAKDLKIPLSRAIINSGLVNESNLALSLEAQRLIEEKEITSDLAIRALRMSVQKKIAFPEAIRRAKELHKTTQVVVSAANDLTNLLVAAGVLSREQLGPLLVKVHESELMVGQLLVLENMVSTDGLLVALNAVLMVKDAGLAKEHAVKGVKYAYERKTSLEQALFELGKFIHPDAKTTRIGELFLMAGLIHKEDLAECLEIELFKKKQFGQILLERGLATAEQLQSAVSLLSAISDGIMQPFQASQALAAVCKDGKDVYAAMAEFRTAGAEEVNARLGDLLVEAEVCTRDDIEQALIKNPESAVKVGSALLKAGIISESTLFAALRLQTSLRLGYMSRDKAVSVLKHCISNSATVEQSFDVENTYVPSRMQWTWV